MSTFKSNGNPSERFALLAQMNEKIFHSGDLANIWRIKDPNTLYTTLKRYTDRGLLYRIHKGFYSLIKPADIHPYLLGLKALHEYSYVSCETILYQNGLFHQKPSYITLVSSKSRKFYINNINYLSRQMKEEYLFNPEGIILSDDIRKASVERAVADMLYFNPEVHIDAQEKVDREKVDNIRKKIGFFK